MRPILFLIAVSTVYLAAEANAQNKPHITERPNAAQISQYYPILAMKQEVSGKTRIRCMADGNGVPSNCELLHEWPVGFNFGEAAVKIGRLFRTAGGPGPFTADINFKLWEDDPGPAFVRFIRFDQSQSTRGRLLKLSTSPTETQILAVYPNGATTVTRVQFTCSVDNNMVLKSCVAEDQADGDPRFAVAALTLVPFFQISDSKADLAGATVECNILFIPPDPILQGN